MKNKKLPSLNPAQPLNLFPWEARTLNTAELTPAHFTPKNFRIFQLCIAVTLGAGWVLAGAPFILLALIPVLVRLIALDVQYHVLPDVYVWPLALGGVAYALSIGAVFPSIIGVWAGLAFGLIINAILWILSRKKGGLGGGDIKLLAATGAWLGLGMVPVVLWLGVVFSLPWLFRPKAEMPLGPGLILAFWIALLYKNSLETLILSLW